MLISNFKLSNDFVYNIINNLNLNYGRIKSKIRVAD